MGIYIRSLELKMRSVVEMFRQLKFLRIFEEAWSHLTLLCVVQGLWSSLQPRLVSLTLTDCINVADECICAITQLLPALYEFNLQVIVHSAPTSTLRD